MNFTEFSQNTVGKLNQFPHQKIANALSLVLVVALAFKAASLTWSFIPAAKMDNTPINTAPIQLGSVLSKEANSINIADVTRLHLFGEANKIEQPKPKPVEKPPTGEIVDSQIKLDIRGIIAAEESARSSIILKDRGKDTIFLIGDKLPGGDYLLEQIESKRVIIRRNGRLEAVNFDDMKFASFKVEGGNTGISAQAPVNLTQTNTQKEVVDKREDKALAKMLGGYREKLLNDPMGMMNSGELMLASPVFRNGQLKGFRIRPGKNRDAFKQSGLRRNDIVTSINGTTLTDPSAAMALIGTLGSASQLSLSVERGSQQVDVILGLSNE